MSSEDRDMGEQAVAVLDKLAEQAGAMQPMGEVIVREYVRANTFEALGYLVVAIALAIFMATRSKRKDDEWEILRAAALFASLAFFAILFFVVASNALAPHYSIIRSLLP